ncbi:MAG: hemerythrin domain-containing protein [Candidatus Pacearchaeota archaeon]|nr:hemerythrin domain-containing protein [Candidatus Pacearchaeota archaeon]
MVEMGPITLAMLKQHAIVNKILLDFEKIPKNDTYYIEKFNLFKWNLNKHVFVEEENIFPVTDKNNKVEMKQLQNLLKDHKDIKGIIRNMEDEISDGKKPNTMFLRELLFSHEGREIKSFYPLLDLRLSPARKRMILNQISEVKLR